MEAGETKNGASLTSDDHGRKEETNDEYSSSHQHESNHDQQELLGGNNVLETQPLKSVNCDPPLYSALEETPISEEKDKAAPAKAEKQDKNEATTGCRECCSCFTEDMDAWCDCLAAVCCCMCLWK